MTQIIIEGTGDEASYNISFSDSDTGGQGTVTREQDIWEGEGDITVKNDESSNGGLRIRLEGETILVSPGETKIFTFLNGNGDNKDRNNGNDDDSDSKRALLLGGGFIGLAIALESLRRK